MNDKVLEIPMDVMNTPAGRDGNGFVVFETQITSIVGSDGEVYIRKNGVVSIAPNVDETEKA